MARSASTRSDIVAQDPQNPIYIHLQTARQSSGDSLGETTLLIVVFFGPFFVPPSQCAYWYALGRYFLAEVIYVCFSFRTARCFSPRSNAFSAASCWSGRPGILLYRSFTGALRECSSPSLIILIRLAAGKGLGASAHAHSPDEATSYQSLSRGPASQSFHSRR